jgi:hypothetical protein
MAVEATMTGWLQLTKMMRSLCGRIVRVESKVSKKAMRSMQKHTIKSSIYKIRKARDRKENHAATRQFSFA